MAKFRWKADKIARELQDCEQQIKLAPEQQPRKIFARYAKQSRVDKRDARATT